MLMLMLMFVVTKVSDSSLLCIMSAVRRHSRPAELERQQYKQNDGEEAVHSRKSSG